MKLESVLIGKSSAVKKLRKEIPEFSTLERILIAGERGTGKSLLARLIHESSKAKTKLTTITQATSSESTIKEIFTKAAGNDTILIQGVEEFSFLNQGIIVNWLNNLSRKSSPQVIITTHRDIGEAKKEGVFLKELGDIVKTFHTIAVPPLTERPEDIPQLVEFFTKKACETVGTPLKVIDVNTIDFLVRHEWKGNILELKSVIERAIFTSQGNTIELPRYLVDEHAQVDGIVASIKDKKAFLFDESLSNLEKTFIEKTLDAVGYHQAKAAEILNITPQNLRYRLRKFKIPMSDK